MGTFEDYVFTKNTKWIFWGLGALVLAFLIFHAGVVVGSHRIERPRAGQEHGFRVPFGAPGFMLPEGFIVGGHGAVGTIQTVTLPTFLIKEPDGDTETITVDASTAIRIQNQSTTSEALSPGEEVIIVGTPGTSTEELHANIIRITR